MNSKIRLYSLLLNLVFLGLLALLQIPRTHAAQGVELVHLASYTNGAPYSTSASEIVAYDWASQRLYVVNAQGKRVDVLDLDDPADPVKIGAIDLSAIGSVVNSVAVQDGIIAVAVEGAVKTDPGHAVFYDSNFNLLKSVQVGSLPDMLTFSPDGRWVLVANEGEPNTYNNFGSETNGPSVDPEGSISVIDISNGIAAATVRTASFTNFNGTNLPAGVRVYGPNATVAQDLEPEYITIEDDSRTAYVTLQENNALAVLNIRDAVVTKLIPLGTKNHAARGHGLDASDLDGGNQIYTWPVRGVYEPDSIDHATLKGETYLFLANEGDTRVYPGFTEEARVGSLTLDPAAFPEAALLKATNNLGRLVVTRVNSDPDGDGDVDTLYVPGARSFSVRKTNGQLVWDSEDDFEQLTALMFPTNFNASNTSNARDGRSTTKGPEPEGLVVGEAFGETFVFVGFERFGGVVVYNVSNPKHPVLVDYVNTRTLVEPFAFETAGDLGPEGLIFIPAKDSPSGKPLLVVAHEISGSTAIFEVKKTKKGKN